jgi:glycosyltransferase involved in cell wall biosynthesis
VSIREADRPIIQIGPLPPPYGGVAVHIQRLAATLADNGLRVTVFAQPGCAAIPGVEVVHLEDFTWRGWLRSGGLRRHPRVVHCHEGFEWSPALLWTVLLGVRVVVTVHSETTMRGLTALPWRHRVASRMMLACPRVRWIAVSARIRDGLVREGVRADRVVVAPAYLPISEGGYDPALPAGLAAFAEGHHPLLVAYGWYVSVMPDGSDLYGFDLAIEALQRLQATHARCGLVLLIPGGEPAGRVGALRRDIEERGLGHSAVVWTEALADPTPLWSAADVYLRPSRSDGDAVSVREVLALGVAVVASDCCDRPEAASLFESGDAEALTLAVQEALSAPGTAPRIDSSAVDALRVIAESYGLRGGVFVNAPVPDRTEPRGGR